MKKEATEKKIYESALKLFSEKGYSATSTRQIADDAGVAEGTVFKYYKTKRDIISKMLDDLVKIFSDQKALRSIDKIIDDAKSTDPEIVLGELIRDRIVIFREHTALVKVILVESQHDQGISRKFYYALMTKVLPALLDYFGRCANEGVTKQLSKDESMVALRLFISMVAGFVFQRNYAPNLLGIDEDKDIEMMVTLFLTGLRVN